MSKVQEKNESDAAYAKRIAEQDKSYALWLVDNAPRSVETELRKILGVSTAPLHERGAWDTKSQPL